MCFELNSGWYDHSLFALLMEKPKAIATTIDKSLYILVRCSDEGNIIPEKDIANYTCSAKTYCGEGSKFKNTTICTN